MTIGVKIKEYRLKKGWTQEQLSEILNVSRSTISSWEVERNYPDIETLIEISELFEVTIDSLLKEDNKMLKSIDFNKKQKNQFKISIVILSVISVILTIFIVVNFVNHPTIVFEKEAVSSSLEMDTFLKEEIKDINIKGNTVSIRFQSSVKSPYYGYMASSDDKGEAFLNLYKTRTLNDDSLKYDGTLQINFDSIPKINKLTVFVNE